MDETGQRLLSLMFRPGERVCVSHNKYGYHSIPLENAFLDKVTLESRDSERFSEKVSSDRLVLVSLNPNNKWREDESCTAFRNILVEMDTGPLKQQLEYIKTKGLPYSASVFSGNKSIHFLISLDEDFKDEDEYRMFSQWILRAIPLADQKTFNPSRSIRIPGAYREPGKKQRLVELKGPVKKIDLVNWLNKHMDARPKSETVREKSEDFAYEHLRPWVRKRLINGLDKRKGRSNQWYAIAYEFALSGYSEDDTLRLLGGFFMPDRDFKEKEWKTTVLSAFKHVDKK